MPDVRQIVCDDHLVTGHVDTRDRLTGLSGLEIIPLDVELGLEEAAVSRMTWPKNLIPKAIEISGQKYSVEEVHRNEEGEIIALTVADESGVVSTIDFPPQGGIDIYLAILDKETGEVETIMLLGEEGRAESVVPPDGATIFYVETRQEQSALLFDAIVDDTEGWQQNPFRALEDYLGTEAVAEETPVREGAVVLVGMEAPAAPEAAIFEGGEAVYAEEAVLSPGFNPFVFDGLGGQTSSSGSSFGSGPGRAARQDAGLVRYTVAVDAPDMSPGSGLILGVVVASGGELSDAAVVLPGDLNGLDAGAEETRRFGQIRAGEDSKGGRVSGTDRGAGGGAPFVAGGQLVFAGRSLEKGRGRDELFLSKARSSRTRKGDELRIGGGESVAGSEVTPLIVAFASGDKGGAGVPKPLITRDDAGISEGTQEDSKVAHGKVASADNRQGSEHGDEDGRDAPEDILEEGLA